MKSNYLHMLRNLLPVAVLLLLGAGCGSNGSTAAMPGATGSLSAKLAWNATNRPVTGKVATKAAAGVAVIRILVTGAGMPGLQQDFSAADGNGLIDGIPSGNGRILTAQGLNALGVVTYQGSLSGITILAGQTTDVGVISMQPLTLSNPPIETEPNDSPPSAMKIVIGGGTFKGQLADASDVDYYTFTSDGGWVDFAVLSEIALSYDESARISILATDGTTILASALLRGSDTVLPVSLGISTTAGGIYFLRVDKDPSQSKILTKSYLVTPTYGLIPSESEPNNSIATATAISIANGKFAGQLSSSLDIDYYSFVSLGGTVRLNMVSAGTATFGETVSVSILTSEGVLMAATTLSGADVLFPVKLGISTVAGKTYLISVSKDPASAKTFSKPYYVTPEYSSEPYEMEPNDSMSTATTMLAGQIPWTGQLSSNEDIDWYRFTATGQSASFSIVSDGAITFNQSLRVSMFAQDGVTALASAVVKGSDTVVPIVLSADTIPGSTYYLQVAKDSSVPDVFSKAYIITPKF